MTKTIITPQGQVVAKPEGITHNPRIMSTVGERTQSFNEWAEHLHHELTGKYKMPKITISKYHPTIEEGETIMVLEMKKPVHREHFNRLLEDITERVKTVYGSIVVNINNSENF